jgi:hypothetical protein
VAAPVRLEAPVFSEARLEALGAIAGYNRYEALGRMAHLWSWCTDRATYVATEAIVRGCLGPAGVEAILGAELGERVEGGIRVRGTAGRVEWLDVKRKAAAAGGSATKALKSAKAATRQPDRSQTEATRQPEASHTAATVEPDGSPLTLSLTPEISEPVSPPSRRKPTRLLPADWVPTPEHEQMAREHGLNLTGEADKFRDWAAAKGEVKADWNAAFRNWLRSAAERNQRGSPGLFRGGSKPEGPPPPKRELRT